VDKAVESRGKDPWGRKYTVHQKGDLEASIASLGPDGVKGTWDDVTVSIQHDDLCPRSGWVRGIGDMGGGGHRMAVKGGLMVEDGMVAMEMAAVPTAGAPAADKKRETRTLAESEPKDDADDPDSSTSGGEDTVRIRTWFPETLFVEDCLITDSKGKASLEIPLADSITTWRMSTVASDANGRLGGADQGIRVFQDFFVDVDFPVFLTKEDEVSFPVVVYNYLDEAQDVTLQVKPENWYRLLGESTATLRLKAGEVASIHVPVKVTRVGWHSLTVHANGSKGFADAVQRTVEVRPDGEETIATESGRFKMDGDRAADDDITSTFEFPKSAVEGSPKAWVQILPGLSSHVVQGMESMLRLPGGCFEQTTSSAWPNVLALKYMKDTEQGTPEIEMKAMQYVNVGYQRILTFECASGGFNWWQGDNPGNTILSALAIQMLRDTKQVYSAVDEAVLKRTYAYLEKTQKADGSWGEERHLHAGNENLGAGSMRGTCYVVWSLNVGGFETSTAARKGMQYITRNLRQEKDLYTQGMCAIALATGNGERSLLDDLLKGIREKARVDGDKMYWENKGMTLVNSYGPSANVEVTALMALAFLHAGFRPNEVPWIVNYLAATKDPNGNWGYNTQATVLALKTFIMAQKLEGGDTDATVSVLLNGEPAGQRHFDNANRDVVWQVEFPESRLKDKNTVTLRYTGKGSLGYQLVHSYFTPTPKDLRPTEGPLSIELTYDRREIKVNDTVTVKARMLNKDPRSQGMILVTLGIPPGFDVLTEDLDTQREGGAIQRYELTGRQVLLYLDGLPVNEPLVVEYRLKARYPVTAQTGEAEVGFYYNREVFARTPGTQIKAQ